MHPDTNQPYPQASDQIVEQPAQQPEVQAAPTPAVELDRDALVKAALANVYEAHRRYPQPEPNPDVLPKKAA